jgi:hypothetical protein
VVALCRVRLHEFWEASLVARLRRRSMLAPFEDCVDGRGINQMSLRCLTAEVSKEQTFAEVIIEERAELAGQR